ncbi:MAG: tRNA (adenosine(37)-N6)-threonylcarbamoyltransferase complex ATPase subunit type 1 TsaE [Bacteroidetes bacterium]|nr:tRNA (adenosine(37)-N6)-threonylcarbamoyltransferase complex ATPase subunit type 1 TsaE [Bacteroidota bacterium]MDA0902949.1 tRNA (adenosine(37)-N6)-threonylcarbamoyltransferase complex ATPase subunit type 1 TsaE [Bacteroidota bacterium]MDA1241635.1 tRNA (adenosine(37)-N6)-threonylcarbamoyltransferase complex ATPase subunit type 1 TsaE [Bacteroidota bacterium]
MSTLVEFARWEGVLLEDLPRVSAELAMLLPTQGVVAIHGPMGAGKTTLVRAILHCWGVGEDAASPTFGLVHHHRVKRRGLESEVRHLDLYRLEGEDEAERSGIAEMLMDPGLNLVEWPERVPDLMPEDAFLLEVQTTQSPTRTLILSTLQG